MYTFFMLLLLTPIAFLTTTAFPELDQYFVSIGALAGAVVIVTEFLKKLKFIAASPSWVIQLLSWVISIAGAFIGNYFDLGIFAELTTTVTVIYGFAVGLVANGVFDFAFIQAVLNLFKKKNES